MTDKSKSELLQEINQLKLVIYGLRLKMNKNLTPRQRANKKYWKKHGWKYTAEKKREKRKKLESDAKPIIGGDCG